MARRSPAGKIAQVDKATHAWRHFARDSTFFGCTLEQFEAAARPSYETRAEIEDLRQRLDSAIHRRDAADAETMRLLEGVVNGVKGDPMFGEDSALYESMGYVRANARKKGRRRRRDRTVGSASGAT